MHKINLGLRMARCEWKYIRLVWNEVLGAFLWSARYSEMKWRRWGLCFQDKVVDGEEPGLPRACTCAPY